MILRLVLKQHLSVLAVGFPCDAAVSCVRLCARLVVFAAKKRGDLLIFPRHACSCNSLIRKQAARQQTKSQGIKIAAGRLR